MISGKVGMHQEDVGEQRQHVVGDPAQVGGRDADDHREHGGEQTRRPPRSSATAGCRRSSCAQMSWPRAVVPSKCWRRRLQRRREPVALGSSTEVNRPGQAAITMKINEEDRSRRWPCGFELIARRSPRAAPVRGPGSLRSPARGRRAVAVIASTPSPVCAGRARRWRGRRPAPRASTATVNSMNSACISG